MKLRVIAAAAILATTATVSCIPQPLTATTDTLQVDGIGTWSEPAFDLFAGFYVDRCSPRAQGSVFYVMAYPPGQGEVMSTADILQYVVMRQDETTPDATGAFPVPTAGHYSWGYVDGVGTSFDLGTGADYNGNRRMQLGALDISEIEVDQLPMPTCTTSWKVTRLRATFAISTPAGTQTGTMRIG